jgi:hypothetical protein
MVDDERYHAGGEFVDPVEFILPVDGWIVEALAIQQPNTICAISRAVAGRSPLAGQQLPLALPGPFRRILGRRGCADLQVDLIGIRRPVSDRGADQSQGHAGVGGHERENVLLGQL